MADFSYFQRTVDKLQSDIINLEREVRAYKASVDQLTQVVRHQDTQIATLQTAMVNLKTKGALENVPQTKNLGLTLGDLSLRN